MANRNRVIGFFLLFEALVLYFFHPNRYDYLYSAVCGVNYLASLCIYLVLKKKRNYFDFDCLFFTAFFFVTLFYPIFLYESDPTRYFAFQYEYDHNTISQASGLAALGANCFMFGSLLVGNKNVEAVRKPRYIPARHFFYIALLSFVLYIVTGGYSSLASAYTNEGATISVVANYLFLFCPSFLLAGIVINFENVKNTGVSGFKAITKLSYVGVFISAIVVFAILAVGSRTVPMQIVLAGMGLFTLCFYKISFPKFITVAIVGIFAMFLIVITRGQSDADYQFKPADLVLDLIVNNRNSYVAIEYVKTNGFTFGESMTASLFAPIPFLQNLAINLLGMDVTKMASSILISKLSMGELTELGFGTNIIADIYMAFGVPGVIFLMSILGFFIANILKHAKTNLYAMAAYGVMMSYSIFLVRAEFFFPLRFLIWTLIIVYLAKRHKDYFFRKG